MLFVIIKKKVPLNLKETFCCTSKQSVMLYKIECWVIKSQQGNELNVTEMRKLHWMSGHTRKDKIKNECNRKLG